MLWNFRHTLWTETYKVKNIQVLNIKKLYKAFKDDLPFSSASQMTSMSSPSGDVYEYLPRATYKFIDTFD